MSVRILHRVLLSATPARPWQSKWCDSGAWKTAPLFCLLYFPPVLWYNIWYGIYSACTGRYADGQRYTFVREYERGGEEDVQTCVHRYHYGVAASRISRRWYRTGEGSVEGTDEINIALWSNGRTLGFEPSRCRFGVHLLMRKVQGSIPCGRT